MGNMLVMDLTGSGPVRMGGELRFSLSSFWRCEMSKRRLLSIAASGPALLACVGLFIGCGDTPRPPLAPDDGAALTEQPDTGVALAKKAGKDKKDKKDKKGRKSGEPSERDQYTSKTIPVRKGGTLQVHFEKYGSRRAITVAKATLRIPKGSIVWTGAGHAPKIEMWAHSGTSVDEVNFVFAPGENRVDFRPNATLTIYLRGPVSADNVLEALHIPGDGSEIEHIKTVTDRRGEAFLVVTVKVPGFSRYSLGDGDFAEADGPAW